MSKTLRKRLKPSKPYPSFPLTAHNNGQWCKKIRGKIYFFGVWQEPDAALQRYLHIAADLHAGRQPRESTLPSDGITVKNVCNHFLTYQHRRAEAGEIGQRWFEDCRTVLESFGHFTGPNRLASDLTPEDFHKFRLKLVRGGLTGRKGLGVYALNRAITIVRGVFKYAYDNDLLDRPAKFAQALDKPSATLKRKSRRAAEQANGKRLFESSEILAMIKTADIPMRAMIFLGINGGFGNTDCARLPMSAVCFDSRIIEFDRPKTGIERIVPLWSETVAALQESIAVRPRPAHDDADKLLFLTKSGLPWVRQNVRTAADSGIAKVITVDGIVRAFNKLLNELGFKRKGLGFYALRHTFRTWADEVKDPHAILRVMGHAIPGMSGIYVEKIELDRLRAVVNHVRGKLFQD